MGVTFAYAADIVKSERDENGDLIVYGKATGPDLDLDGQICDPKWLKSAMPAWMEWGNVREMHQPIAAGVGIELVEDGDDWYLKSKCVDPNTAKKIEEGVLKGYSVGIKGPKIVKDAAAPGGRIVGGGIVETSYVDRPCNPTAKMAICKMVGGSLQPVEADDQVDVDKGVDADLVKQATDLAAEISALVPDLDKATPEQDIADAKAAIAAIARLIQSEADGLAAGYLNEIGDISMLLDAVRALRWFINCEQGEAQTGDVDVIALGTDPDLTKAAGDKPAPKTPDAPAPDKNTLADMVKSAVAEANKASEERIQALEAELTKVKQRPVPGGPVLARPVQDLTKATTRSSLLEQASQFEAKATQLRPVDANAASGYTQKARELRAQAETL